MDQDVMKPASDFLVWVNALSFLEMLTLLVEEEYPVCKNPCHLSQRFSSRENGGRKPMGNHLTQVHLENGH